MLLQKIINALSMPETTIHCKWLPVRHATNPPCVLVLLMGVRNVPFRPAVLLVTRTQEGDWEKNDRCPICDGCHHPSNGVRSLSSPKRIAKPIAKRKTHRAHGAHGAHKAHSAISIKNQQSAPTHKAHSAISIKRLLIT